MDLIDTDVLIDIQRNHAPAIQWFASLTDLPAVPGFVAMELVQGAANARQLSEAIRIVAPFRIVWPTSADCDRALADFRSYHLSHSLGLIDALIAACAIGLGTTLYTFNTRHFSAVPGIVIAKPYTR